MTLHTFAGAMALGVTTALAGALPAASKSTPSTDASPAEVKWLVGEFRGAIKEPDRRAEIVRKAVQAGPAAATGIMTAIYRELAPEVTRYTGKFSQKAAPLAKKRCSGVRVEEISKWRQTVLDLKNGPNFTHETIVAQADPAMKRLREIFVVSRDEVLASAPDLQKDRGKLIEAARLWDQCAECVYQHLPDDGKKPHEAPSFERYLRGEEELAAMLAGPVDPATRNTLAANAPKAMQLDGEEGRAIWEANLTRVLLGLPTLEIDLKLCEAARDHCHDMEKLNFFAHESPVEGKKTPWERAKRMGTTASGENIGTGDQNGEAAHLAWFHSPGHHVNMLAAHRRIGVGRSGTLYTEMFGD